MKPGYADAPGLISVQKADILISPPHPSTRNFPFTRSYAGCGHPGIHVQVNTDFVLKPGRPNYSCGNPPICGKPGKYPVVTSIDLWCDESDRINSVDYTSVWLLKPDLWSLVNWYYYWNLCRMIAFFNYTSRVYCGSIDIRRRENIQLHMLYCTIFT